MAFIAKGLANVITNFLANVMANFTICRYYLYSSLPSDAGLGDDFFSLSPGGLANGQRGEDYQGHVFWDAVSYG